MVRQSVLDWLITARMSNWSSFQMSGERAPTVWSHTNCTFSIFHSQREGEGVNFGIHPVKVGLLVGWYVPSVPR